MQLSETDSERDYVKYCAHVFDWRRSCTATFKEMAVSLSKQQIFGRASPRAEVATWTNNKQRTKTSAGCQTSKTVEFGTQSQWSGFVWFVRVVHFVSVVWVCLGVPGRLAGRVTKALFRSSLQDEPFWESGLVHPLHILGAETMKWSLDWLSAMYTTGQTAVGMTSKEWAW